MKWLTDRIVLKKHDLTTFILLGRQSDFKLKLEVKGFNLDECSNVYLERNFFKLGKDVLCAGGEEGKDSCSGDSGDFKCNQSDLRRLDFL